MTVWSNFRRGEVEEARRHILDVLGTRAHWSEEQLIDVTGLTQKRFQTVMMSLLEDGFVDRQPPVEGEQPYTSYRSSTLHRSSVLHADEVALLPTVALSVLAHLDGRSDTARRIAATLKLSVDDTVRALALLQKHHLVICRYVGMLTIYHRAS